MDSERVVSGNSGGSFSVLQTVSGDNDIIIGQPESKKSHKKWIVGGVLVIFCVALIILLLFVVFRNNKAIDPQNLDEINKKISNYSSTILYGDGRQVDLSVVEYSDSINYKFRREIMNDNQEYMELVMDEFNSVDSLIDEDGRLNLTDSGRYYFEVYRDKLQFLDIYLDSLDEDPLVIIKQIVEGGEDEAISYIEMRYSEYINSDNSSLRDYFTYKDEYERLAVNVLLRTDVDGCIIGDSTTLSCEVESLMTEEETLRMQEIQNEMQAIVNMNIRYIITGCWNIYDIVNGVENV